MDENYSRESIILASDVKEFVTMNLIDVRKWTAKRWVVAEEQFGYLKTGIPVGEVDGLVGPQTIYAREVAKSRAAGSDIEETWRDLVEPGPVTQTKTVWPTQAKVESVFGVPGASQVMVKMPFPFVIAWDLNKKIKEFSCHRLVKPSMERIWNKTFDHYGQQKMVDLRLHYFGGCLNVRKMRGGSNWSMHSWGIAMDIDPERNALKTPWKNASLSRPEYKKFWEYVYDEGAISLGIERNYDAMHFQFARL
jgi:hypothetical protein